MLKTRNLFAFLFAGILVLSSIGCAAATGTAATRAAGSRTVPVQRGNLSVTVSVDGNLNMPQAFDLHFGAPGNVKDVRVQEGDVVKAGMIMATLDDTQQALAIKSANNSVQSVLSNLYETVPRLPQFRTNYWAPDASGSTVLQPLPSSLILQVGFPSYYPSGTAFTSYAWALDEITNAHNLFNAENYTAATSELYVALSDLEACTQIMQDTINNPESGLGNMAPFVPDASQYTVSPEMILEQPAAVPLIVELRKVVKQIKNSQADIETVRSLTVEGKYEEASPLFESLLSRIDDLGIAVVNNINFIKSNGNTTVYGKDISLYFYSAAEDKLNSAMAGIEKGGLNSSELADNLRIATHYMELCNAIMGTNDYVLQHGLSIQKQQNYNINLANTLVTLKDRKDDFLKTVIMSPFDGTVVSVGVKSNDVLSNIDYASKGSIQVVDTSQIEFKGTVDEIDILKIKSGQKVNISVDAVPNKTFTGRVAFISPYGTADTNNVVKFNVTILLDPTGVPLKGKLTATADIAVSTAENVLLIPLTAVTTTAAGSTVNVMDPATDKAEKRNVTLGSKNLQLAEVLSGLKEGDKVVIEERTIGAPVVTTPQGPPGGGGGGPQGR